MTEFSPMDTEDARNILLLANGYDPAEVDAGRMIHAGLSLNHEVRRLERELEYLRARTKSTRAALTADVEVEGHPLIEGRDSGGLRHYLDDRPVNAGSELYLLTNLGWMPGRYEWGFRSGTLGKFLFRLPGVHTRATIFIEAGARLAWPNEIRDD